MVYLLDSALSVAEASAHDERADRKLAALVSPAVQVSGNQYQYVNALIPDAEGAPIVVKICLRADKSIAWDTRHLSRHDIARIADKERRIARTRAAFLTTVLRGLRGCGSQPASK